MWGFSPTTSLCSLVDLYLPDACFQLHQETAPQQAAAPLLPVSKSHSSGVLKPPSHPHANGCYYLPDACFQLHQETVPQPVAAPLLPVFQSHSSEVEAAQEIIRKALLEQMLIYCDFTLTHNGPYSQKRTKYSPPPFQEQVRFHGLGFFLLCFVSQLPAKNTEYCEEQLYCCNCFIAQQNHSERAVTQLVLQDINSLYILANKHTKNEKKIKRYFFLA